ncbi:MAG: GFA family protein [Proteobacteria bacterium]|nr:GFA family protein [Pseudomonadota bacterium]
MTDIHHGGCQCGKVRFRVELALGEVYACNCSRCGRLGSLLAFAPIDKFSLLSGEDALQSYEFNKHVIKHKFCKICGIESFAIGRAPKTRGEMAAVNVRCLDDIDIGALTVKQVDGKSF